MRKTGRLRFLLVVPMVLLLETVPYSAIADQEDDDAAKEVAHFIATWDGPTEMAEILETASKAVPLLHQADAKPANTIEAICIKSRDAHFLSLAIALTNWLEQGNRSVEERVIAARVALVLARIDEIGFTPLRMLGSDENSNVRLEAIKAMAQFSYSPGNDEIPFFVSQYYSERNQQVKGTHRELVQNYQPRILKYGPGCVLPVIRAMFDNLRARIGMPPVKW